MSLFERSLAITHDMGLESLAFPLIWSGLNMYPAVEIIKAILDACSLFRQRDSPLKRSSLSYGLEMTKIKRLVMRYCLSFHMHFIFAIFMIFTKIIVQIIYWCRVYSTHDDQSNFRFKLEIHELNIETINLKLIPLAPTAQTYCCYDTQLWHKERCIKQSNQPNLEALFSSAYISKISMHPCQKISQSHFWHLRWYDLRVWCWSEIKPQSYKQFFLWKKSLVPH